MLRFFLTAFFLCFTLAPSAGDDATRAQPPELNRVRQKMERIDDNVSRLQEQLTSIRSDSSKLSEEISALELERALISAKVQKHELELAQTQVRLDETEGRHRALDEQAASQKERIHQRLRQLYKRGNLGYAQFLLKESERADLITAYHYAKILTERDHNLLAEYRETQRALEETAAELRAFRDSAAKTRASLAEQQTELDALLKKRAARLRTIRRTSKQKMTLLKELELEKEELELMVRRLTEEDADPMALRVPISRYKGRLDWPALGKILRRFGVYIDPEYATKRRQNGVTLRMDKGTPIKSVYSGKVIYADWFKNYGNLIIIDHSERITTFYAHCEQILVKRGDFVERDQEIATSGDSASLEGPVLHFEIRNRTKPEDPKGWLKQGR